MRFSRASLHLLTGCWAAAFALYLTAGCQVNSWPAYDISRNAEDWGWQLENVRAAPRRALCCCCGFVSHNTWERGLLPRQDWVVYRTVSAVSAQPAWANRPV